MEELKNVLQETLNDRLKQIVLSNSRDVSTASKIKIRPVLIKGQLVFQETLYRGNQVFHQNLDAIGTAERITSLLEAVFCQCEIHHKEQEALVLVSKKGRQTIKRKQVKSGMGGEAEDSGERASAACLSHNRTKQYILREGEPVDFLVGLGVQSPDGRIHRTRYDKFRQINRYLEFIEDVLEGLPKDRTIRIIDFGCGKSYLTFAMYYYLHRMQGRDIRVTGLDLKQDVIDTCNRLARELGYTRLSFQQGDISTYEEEGANGQEPVVDMVVSLHACDTATDYALEKAVKWGAKVILAVPCCQHELNRQIRNDTLKPMLKYGLLKERMAALLTDAVRAQILEEYGYDTQILEFIDMEHTPKNLLIRAVKREGMRAKTNREALSEMEAFFHLSPTLERLMRE